MAIIALPQTMASLLLFLATMTLISLVPVVVYRRFFHPLAKIPGPFLASITHLYIFKFNMLSEKSQFYLQVERLHEKYGPVVRISPDEIHLSDPDNYEKIYFFGPKASSKAPYFYNAFGLRTAGFTTISNELHRIRRGALNPLFSRQAVLNLEDMVQSKVEKLINRIKTGVSQGKPVDLHHGYRSLAVDIITDYAFDNCYDLLDTEDFSKDFFDFTYKLGPRLWLLQVFPWIEPLTNMVKPWMVKSVNIYLYNFLIYRAKVVEEISTLKQKIDSEKKSGGSSISRKTIFHQLMDEEATEGHTVLNIDDLTDEAYTILSAAADSSANVMTRTTYFLLCSPSIRSTLVSELTAAFPDPNQRLDFLKLEKLPYLTAVIKEGLRLSFHPPGRLPRVIETDGGLELSGYRVPKGTIVGMSSWMMHRDPNIWPEPEKFLPERWLDPVDGKNLDKYLVNFSKGSRQCIGMQLAYCELYIVIATIFRRPELQNLQKYGMTDKDLEIEDLFAAFPPKGCGILHVVEG